jgi:hypothetical protein
MIDHRKDISCEDFQDQLAELIGTGADASAHPHVQSCDLCRAFVSDLQAIAAAARELFPVQDPSDRVWEQIQSAIQEEEGKTSFK